MAQDLKWMVKVNQVLSVLVFLSLMVCSGWLLYSLVGSQSLVHDEAVYLTKAKSWLVGTPASEFRIYRPIGMPVLGWIALYFDDSEQAVRLVGVLFGVLTVGFTFLLFKSVFDAWIGTAVTVAMMTSSLFLRNAPEFLNDIPSSGLIFGVLWLIWVHYKTSGESRSIYFVPVMIALSFYLRYGVMLVLIIVAVVTLFFLSIRFYHQEGRSYRRIIIASLLLILFFVPHFIQSLSSGNGLFGILSRGTEAAGREYFGQGLVSYIRWMPHEISGWVLGISAIFGVLVVFYVLLFAKFYNGRNTGIVWLGSIGLFHFILTGILVHAEPRYVFLSMTILAGIGITGLYYTITSLSPISANIFIACFIVLSGYFGLSNYQTVSHFFERREASVSRNVYVEASEMITKDNTSNMECAVWSNSFRPQISWYSGCYTLDVKDSTTFNRDYLIHLRRDHYSLVLTKDNDIKIDNEKATEFGVKLTEIFRKRVSATLGEMIVYKIEKTDQIEDIKSKIQVKPIIEPPTNPVVY